MTEAQIIHLLGMPYARQDSPDSANWYYHWSPLFSNRERKMELKFRAGRVVDFQISEVAAASRVNYAVDRVRSREEVNEDEYTDLLLAVKSANTDRNRLDVLRNSLRHIRLSGRQARGLLRQFTFDSERLKAVSIIASNLSADYDKELLLDAFTFSGNASAARTILDALR